MCLKLRKTEPANNKQSSTALVEADNNQTSTTQILSEVGAIGTTAIQTKTNQVQTVPYQYCMPTHALYTTPVPTARTVLVF